MVYSLKSSKQQIYSSIQRAAANTVCSVLIFVSPTVDTLCALKILIHMFRVDFIPFKIIPCSGFNDLSAANEELIQGQDEIRTIIMLGCGGIVDLSEFLSISPDISVFVFDNNRPYNLRNVFSNSQITLIDDGFIEANLQDLEDAYYALDSLEDEDDEDEYYESEEEEATDDENQLSESNRAESKNVKKERVSREFKAMCREKLEVYSTGFWSGSPVSAVMFELCDSRGGANNDLLWNSIIGVTDYYMRSVMTEESYLKEIHVLKNVQERLNLNVIQKSKAEASSNFSNLTNSDGFISFESDFRLVLLRHWNLYSSMINSDFMVSRLGAWREKGRKQLELLLAKMAFPLNQCKSDYSAMDLEYRELLPIQLEKYAQEFNLHNYSFSSFTRDYGYLLKASASDCVHALRSILECPSALTHSKTEHIDKTESVWQNNFFYAFDAIECKNIDYLKDGIELAIKQHQNIYKELCTILSHRQIRLTKNFRYVVLRDLAWLLPHSALRRLCKFLAESTKDGQKGSALPLLVAHFNSRSDTYLLVSMAGESYYEEGEFKNVVGPTFMKAANMINARVKMDTFDLSVMEVKSVDFKPFIKSLQAVLSKR